MGKLASYICFRRDIYVLCYLRRETKESRKISYQKYVILGILLHAALDGCKEVYFLLVLFCCTSVTHISSTSFCPS